MIRALVSIPVWKIFCVIVPALLVGVFAYGLTRDASHIPSVLIGKMAPNFTLKELDKNRQVRRDDYAGKVLIINFWASWCGACKTEHGVLLDLSKRFSNDSDVAFLGVNYRDRKDKALQFLSRYGAFTYPSVVDPRGRTGIDFGVYGLPETYFLDPEGHIVYRHVGALDEKKALSIIKTIRGLS